MKRIALGLVATLALVGAQGLQAATLTATVIVNGVASAPINGVACSAGLCIDLSNQTFGQVTFGAGSGATTNAPGSPSTSSFTNESNLTLINNGATPATVEVIETASGFTTPSGPSNLTLSGTVLAATGTVNYTSTGTANPTLLTLGPCTIVAAPPSTCKVVGTDNLITPFSLQTDTTVVLSAGERISSQTELDATVPEPASMALFGSGLLGLAGVIRRKRAR